MFLIESCNDITSKTELIAEKIAMPSYSSQLARPRLRALLEKNLPSCTSTIISGRAGTGKTALALDFARNCARRVAWYKVDAPEGDQRSFFQYLVASIREQRPGFGQAILMPLVNSAQSDQVSLLAEAFVYELAEGDSEPLLIVIEDLHLVCDSAWLVPFFKRLLPLLPSDVHMLITSRTMPPAPLGECVPSKRSQSWMKKHWRSPGRKPWNSSSATGCRANMPVSLWTIRMGAPLRWPNLHPHFVT